MLALVVMVEFCTVCGISIFLITAVFFIHIRFTVLISVGPLSGTVELHCCLNGVICAGIYGCIHLSHL